MNKVIQLFPKQRKVPQGNTFIYTFNYEEFLRDKLTRARLHHADPETLMRTHERGEGNKGRMDKEVEIFCSSKNNIHLLSILTLMKSEGCRPGNIFELLDLTPELPETPLVAPNSYWIHQNFINVPGINACPRSFRKQLVVFRMDMNKDPSWPLGCKFLGIKD